MRALLFKVAAFLLLACGIAFAQLTPSINFVSGAGVMTNYIYACLATVTGTCTVATKADNTTFSGANGTLVQKLVPGVGKGTAGSQMRFTLVGPITSGSTVLTAAYVGLSQTVGQRKVTAEVISNNGISYTAADTLTVSGGTCSVQPTLTVDTVDGSGNILTASVANGGICTAIPTNPAATTGGTGTGATFSLSWSTASTCATDIGLCPWNFQYGTQVQVTFNGGSSGITMACCNLLYTSDVITFSQGGGTTPISFAANVSSGSRVGRYSIGSANSVPNTFGTITAYTNATATPEAASALKTTGYSTSASALISIQKIEVNP